MRDLNKIQSEAYRQVEEIGGVADAKTTEIYATAYNQSPEAVAFYEFTRTMQSYRSIIGRAGDQVPAGQGERRDGQGEATHKAALQG